MSNHTESDLRFLRRLVRSWDYDGGAKDFDAYLSGEGKKPIYLDGFLDGYSKEEIKEAVELGRAQWVSDDIVQATTLDEWLEIARDFYQDASGSKRRPQLLDNDFLAMLKLEEKYQEGGTTILTSEPELFLNAVLLLAKDPDLDHERFNSLPWVDWGWPRYINKARRDWYAKEPKDDSNDGLGPCLEAEEDHSEEEPKPRTVPDENCQARIHMKASAFAIYNFARGLCGKENTKTCWLSGRITAMWSGVTDRATVKKWIHWLVENGWLIELKAPTSGVGGAGQYSVVEHADWIQKRGTGSCIQRAE